jgi:hypothetical protein
MLLCRSYKTPLFIDLVIFPIKSSCHLFDRCACFFRSFCVRCCLCWCSVALSSTRTMIALLRISIPQGIHKQILCHPWWSRRVGSRFGRQKHTNGKQSSGLHVYFDLLAIALPDGMRVKLFLDLGSVFPNFGPP